MKHKKLFCTGMSRFISFPEDLNDSMNTMTTGIGYYETHKEICQLILSTNWNSFAKELKLERMFLCMDLMLATDWDRNVINEVLENF